MSGARRGSSHFAGNKRSTLPPLPPTSPRAVWSTPRRTCLMSSLLYLYPYESMCISRVSRHVWCCITAPCVPEPALVLL